MKKILKNKFLWAVVVLLAISMINTNFALVWPGEVKCLDEIITVPGGEKEENGSFCMVTVSQQQSVQVFWLIFGLLSPSVDVYREEDMMPPDVDLEEYHQQMAEHMRESQEKAQVVALGRMGYEVDILSDGVEVIGFLSHSPAEGILMEGDLITAADGQKVLMGEELVNIIGDKKVGDEVELQIKRGEEIHTFLISTVSSASKGKEVPALNIYIATKNWQPQLPMEIEIDTADVTGPSAGLMFTLEIMNQLDPVNLTVGRQIAGTGTIELDGEIGSIGGIRQKVIATSKSGAEVFFVPRANYEEAKIVDADIELVPVETLDDALLYLKALQSEEEGCVLNTQPFSSAVGSVF